MKTRTLALTAIAFSAIFASCGKLPQAEIDTAKASVEEAQAAGADIYLPDTYIALQDSMNSVMENVEVQKSKMFKNYSEAKEGLAGVTAYAQEVKVQAEAKKEEVKNEITQLLNEVKTLIESNKQLVAEAPKGKEGATALQAMNNEIGAVETSINEASVMFEQGSYMATLDKVKAAKEKASALNAELQDIMAKYKGRTKKG